MDWSLYDRDLRHERVKFKHNCITQPKWLFQTVNRCNEYLGITADSMENSRVICVIRYFPNWYRIYRRKCKKNMQDCPLLPMLKAQVTENNSRGSFRSPDKVEAFPSNPKHLQSLVFSMPRKVIRLFPYYGRKTFWKTYHLLPLDTQLNVFASGGYDFSFRKILRTYWINDPYVRLARKMNSCLKST